MSVRGSANARVFTKSMASFTCRTLAPWDEVRWRVVNSAGLRLWMNGLYGEELITWGQLEGVREWMKGARDGDVINLSDEGVIVPEGDFEVRCSRTVSKRKN